MSTPIIDEVVVVGQETSANGWELVYVLQVIASTQPLRCGLEFRVFERSSQFATLNVFFKTKVQHIRCKWVPSRTRDDRPTDHPVFFAGLPARSV